MANVSRLQPSLTPQVQTTSTEAQEKEATFLALRLLNRRARPRLSPEPLDLNPFPGKASLFTVANSKRWFAAVTRDVTSASALVLSPLSDLRSAFAAASAEDEQPFHPQRRVPLDGPPPHIITFACNDNRLLLGLLDGSICVYASDQLLSSSEGPVQPIRVFTTSSAPLLSIQPNPGDIPELVAVLRDSSSSSESLAAELFDVHKLVSSGGWMTANSPNTTPTSISWSPKGKQLALGLQSGDIVTFSPTATATPKSCIPHPPSANNMSVISLSWLSSSSFHTVYAPPGPLRPDVEQTHFLVSSDSKSNSAQDIKFNSPYLPFPGLRPPGEFLVCLRGWNPSKVLLFIGDSTSSDIGLIGDVADDSGESWYNLSMEETSTPSLPLDKDQNDTVLLGMDVDLTSGESYHHSTASGEALELPAHPILYVYASDGTIVGWHVLNVTGAQYPGMVTESDASVSMSSVPSAPSSMVRELSTDMQMTPAISPTANASTEEPATTSVPSAFGQSPASGVQGPVFGTSAPTFGQPTFGQSGFGQQPAPVFGRAPSFGQPTPTFGSTSTPSPFGQTSTPAFGSTVPNVGFGVFSSAGPAKFGQPSFGFGGSPQTTTTVPSSTSLPEESMAADDGPSFGGLNLGAAGSQDADSKPSIFGKTNTSSSGQQSTDGGLIKPGNGFGAFSSSFDQKSPFARPTAFSITQQPTETFGVGAFQPKLESTPPTSFGASPSLGTGQSGFGQPSFGQSAFLQFQTGSSIFGKPSFGAVSSATPPATTSATTNTGGGGGSDAFSIFASGTQSAFSVAASKNTSTKPVWAANDSSKTLEPTNVSTKPAEATEFKTPLAMTSKTPTIVPSTASQFTSAHTLSVTPQFAVRESVTKDDNDDSRPSSPAQNQQKETVSLFSVASPTPAVFTGPAPSSLQAAPSAFIKPASGSFGELPKDSPFFASSKPNVSAFSLALSSTPTTTPPKSHSAPLFGASSMPGTGGTFKSAFTTGVTTPTQPPPIPGSSAFSSFSSGSGGFAAFSSGGNKSFGDLLRSGADAKPSGTLTPDTTPRKPEQTPTQPAVSTTPSSTPAQEPPKPLDTIVTSKVEEEVKPAVEEKTSEESGSYKGKGKAAETVTLQESLESISSSTSSSFVKVEQEEGEITGEERTELQDESFLSDVPSESDVSEEEEEEEEEDGDDDREEEEEGGEDEDEETSEDEETEAQVKREVEPTEIPLPITPASTRSPSTTPKAEHPKISVSVSPPLPPPASAPSGVPRISPVRDSSTTPPSSPVKDAPSGTPPTVQTPPLKASPPPTTPFGLAPRSNNRPIRSSPLANTPLVLEGEAEKPPPVSKSAPPAILVQPAAPKVSFGQWTPTPPTPPAKLTEEDSVRPKTSALSSMSSSAPPPASPIFMLNTTRAAGPSAFGFADKVATTTTATTIATVTTPPTTPGPSGPLFPLPLQTSLPSFPPSSGPGTWPSFKPPEVMSGTAKGVPSIFGGGQPSLFGPKTPPTPLSSPAFFMPSTAPSPSPVPSPVVKTPEQGMQAECALLLSTIDKELTTLKDMATAASVKMVELKKPSWIPHQKADLGDPDKWVLGDIDEYGRMLVGLQEDVRELKLQRVCLRQALKELDGHVLRVNTRKEEIARFDRARTDTEFAKILKIRTLAPEYSEAQSQLRRKIRMIKDRVQKLEDHLQTSKKRINELRTGRPSIRPPSLDTVNRAFRNIDLAIDQQKQDMSVLRYRISKLDGPGGVNGRAPLAASTSKRPLNVTPNVAVTTAATLNAERSAQRLKKALLASRTQPLLNTMATGSTIPTSFQTPQRAAPAASTSTAAAVAEGNDDKGKGKEKEKTNEDGFSLPTTPMVMMQFPTTMPSWASPSGSPEGVHDVSPSRSRGGSKHHQKPIVLKKQQTTTATTSTSTLLPVATTSSAPTTSTMTMTSSSPFAPPTSSLALFEWNQVELIKPVSSLPFSLRPTGSM